MSERDDPTALADQLEAGADRLQRQSEILQGEVDAARQDWRRKREDSKVPGAPEPEDDDGAEDDDRAEAEARGSPAPQAPAEGAAPGKAETPQEGAVGPPADRIDDSAS